MNAPQSDAALQKPTLQQVAVSSLIPSKSHVQEVRRARFADKDIKDLADDIKRLGMMHQPIVRVLAGDGNKALEKLGRLLYEIVTGEQRWLAAKKLGMKEIFVNVRELSDDEALEMQLSENLRRKDLHELEEAEGYEELMTLRKISTEVLADMIGRSPSYVSKRMKLLALCPAARKAFYAGEMDASTALLIARIPGAEFQVRAIAELKIAAENGTVLNFKDASAFIRDNFMLRLKQAPFDPNDAALVPAAGSCQKCPKRSGNQPDIFGDQKESDLCTDLKCFDGKRQAHYAVDRKKLEVQGKKVIHGEAAKKLIPNWEQGYEDVRGGHVKLTDWHHELGGRVIDALPKDYEPVLIQHPFSGKIIEAATAQAVTKAKLLQSKGKRAGTASSSRSAPRPSKPKGPDVDQQLTERLVKLIREKAPKEFGKVHLAGLATRVLRMSNARSEDLAYSCKARGWTAGALSGGSYGADKKLPAQAAKFDSRELTLLMFEIAFHSDRYHRKAILEIFGINEDKTREVVIEERKAARSKKKGR